MRPIFNQSKQLHNYYTPLGTFQSVIISWKTGHILATSHSLHFESIFEKYRYFATFGILLASILFMSHYFSSIKSIITFHVSQVLILLKYPIYQYFKNVGTTWKALTFGKYCYFRSIDTFQVLILKNDLYLKSIDNWKVCIFLILRTYWYLNSISRNLESIGIWRAVILEKYRCWKSINVFQSLTLFWHQYFSHRVAFQETKELISTFHVFKVSLLFQ